MATYTVKPKQIPLPVVSCKTCRWSRNRSGGNESAPLECRRFPPTLPNVIGWSFPTVESGSSCGEWKEIPNG